MKIVKFKDGTYAVRRWRPFYYEYADKDLWWRSSWRPLRYVMHAKVQSFEKAQEILARHAKKENRKDRGTVVKPYVSSWL